jgi:hypothetical protein
MIDLLDKEFPSEDEYSKGDFGSALYTTSYSIGEFIGPLMGGIIVS